MTAKFKKGNIDWLNHFVGFVSVLLGVLIAFGLNSWNESRKEARIIDTVLLNIKDELEGNVERLDTAYVANKRLHTFLREYLRSVDDNMDPKISGDSLTQFHQKHHEFISEDLESVSIVIELFQLSNVAWTTAERTNVLSSMEYDMVNDLAQIYDIQEKLMIFDRNILEEVSNVNSSESDKRVWKKMTKDIDTALTFAEILKEIYTEKLKEIGNYSR